MPAGRKVTDEWPEMGTQMTREMGSTKISLSHCAEEERRQQNTPLKRELRRVHTGCTLGARMGARVYPRAPGFFSHSPPAAHPGHASDLSGHGPVRGSNGGARSRAHSTWVHGWVVEWVG